MKKPGNHPAFKVFQSVYILQMLWAFIVLGAIVLLHFVLALVIGDLQWIDRTALSALSNPMQVYMFVMGIIAGAYFLKHFIRHGVTRKHTFAGSLAAGFAVVVSLQVVALALTFLSYGFEAITPYEAGRETIAYLGEERGYILSMTINAALTLVYYLFGWLIGIGFYRFKVLRGFGFIVLAIFAIGITSTMWLPGSEMNVMGIPLHIIETKSLWVAFIITDTVLLFGVVLLYTIHRNAPVKPN